MQISTYNFWHLFICWCFSPRFVLLYLFVYLINNAILNQIFLSIFPPIHPTLNCMIKYLLDSAMADIDLFRLAKIISNSASCLVGYCFARLNKSRYPPSPCPISVYYQIIIRSCNWKQNALKYVSIKHNIYIHLLIMYLLFLSAWCTGISS